MARGTVLSSRGGAEPAFSCDGCCAASGPAMLAATRSERTSDAHSRCLDMDISSSSLRGSRQPDFRLSGLGSIWQMETLEKAGTSR